MENLIQYVNPCNKAFHVYSQDNNIDVLIYNLRCIELDAYKKFDFDIMHTSLWFKFGKDDTLATDIRGIERSLRNSNREFMIEQFESVTSLTGTELQVYYS